MDGGKQKAMVIDSFHVSGFVLFITFVVTINYIYMYINICYIHIYLIFFWDSISHIVRVIYSIFCLQYLPTTSSVLILRKEYKKQLRQITWHLPMLYAQFHLTGKHWQNPKIKVSLKDNPSPGKDHSSMKRQKWNVKLGWIQLKTCLVLLLFGLCTHLLCVPVM